MSTDEHLDEAVEVERVAASIYGTIVAASVMAAGADHLSVGEICAAVLVTVVVYWAAETYARIVAGRILASEAVSEAVREHARHHWRMVTASYAPLAVLLLASLFGADVSAAVLIALVFTTGLLVVLGWVAAGRAEMTGAPRLVAAAVAGVAGLVMIALKLALH
ncbi:MAG TPA: hypothetical protein VFB77_05635 [Acidimicrobiales bacterium]|nr:hypothetical protein [Acidimicrobiales bacterium]